MAEALEVVCGSIKIWQPSWNLTGFSVMFDGSTSLSLGGAATGDAVRKLQNVFAWLANGRNTGEFIWEFDISGPVSFGGRTFDITHERDRELIATMLDAIAYTAWPD